MFFIQSEVLVKEFISNYINLLVLQTQNNNKLVSFDYSQIELRLAAEISQDKNFIEAFI